MKPIEMMPSVFVYKLLGVKQATFNAWLRRGFIIPSHTEGNRNIKRFFSFDEVCWACVFFFFAWGVRADHKTILKWRLLALKALAKGDDFLLLTFGKNLAFQGWAFQKTNSLMQAMASWNISGTYSEMSREIKGNVGSIVVDLAVVRKFVEDAIEKY
jgi:hypothetical protein